MFYCDACATEKQYPITDDDRLKSFGTCEVCGKTATCYNFTGDVLSLGHVTIYITPAEKVLSTTDSCFKAKKDNYRVIGFDIDHIWGG